AKDLHQQISKGNRTQQISDHRDDDVESNHPLDWLFQPESLQFGVLGSVFLRLTLVQKELPRCHCTEVRWRSFQQRHQLTQRMGTRPCQREMWMIGLLFAGNSQLLEGGVDRSGQLRQRLSTINADPEHAGSFWIGKEPDALKLHFKLRGLDRRK